MMQHSAVNPAEQPLPDFITVEALNQYTNHEDVVFIDVRDRQSFDAGHLPKARHLLPEDLVRCIHELDSEKQYIIICYHGIMAVPLADFMQEQGFSAGVLRGGMAAVESAKL